mmetsp:Transcript_10885/g.25227  ORF Transcript_10885/g.25227 Transcript_10885/m.25227 type:complete len:123 (+) Transcript_10885:137-505(+)
MEELIESQRATCSLILAVALFLICIHVIFMVTNVLLSSLSFFLVWNEIFRIQRPSGTPMARGVVTKAFEKGSMAAAAAAGSGESTCPICLSEYREYTSSLYVLDPTLSDPLFFFYSQRWEMS